MISFEFLFIVGLFPCIPRCNLALLLTYFEEFIDFLFSMYHDDKNRFIL